ncbi:COG3014 family protein [Thalassotalea litorea]|uniref:COG3014 family protein n=1 Tax=Thalassotalea litorea TaxID=2020715 RepID=UPI003734E227
MRSHFFSSVKPHQRTYWFASLGMLVLLTGCAGMQFSDMFSGYAQQMQPVRAQIDQGQVQQAQSLVIQRGKTENSYALSQLERGRLAFLANDWPASQQAFEEAYNYVRTTNEQAKIRVSESLNQASALLSNDNALPYIIPSFEQSMMHSYQAINYLMQGDREGALVEVRRANIVQENALKQNQKKIDQARDDALQKANVSESSLYSSFPDMESTLADVKSGFQNAYTFYLSGVLYEGSDELNDAYIDYKRALEINPQSPVIINDVQRLAQRLQMEDDIERFKARYGTYQPKSATTQGKGDVVVMIELGQIIPRQDASINIPASHHGNLRFYSLSLPSYNHASQFAAPSKVQLSQEGKYLVADPILDLLPLAKFQLYDQMPGMVARQVLRIFAKEEIRQEAARSGGDVGNVLASLYNMASERADTRSWLTLPQQIQVLRQPLIAGPQTIQVDYNGQQQTIDVEVKENRITLIKLTVTGNYIGYISSNL